MAAYLTFSTGTGTERVPCGTHVITIGRDRNNQIVLRDLLVSRNHAMVRCIGGTRYYLIDSGSSNGSRLNERRITTPTLLHHGDRISIGSTDFLFEQEPQPAALVDSLSFQDTMVIDSPRIKEITILVADIRGFTTMSEHLPIQTLTKVMNLWFNRVSEVIAERRGTVDKFIGDCVFARWDSDRPKENVIEALRTACEINAITAGLNEEFPEVPFPLRIGAGIHTGVASLDIGSENTALGDSVNTAFRLESASKEIGTDIVLSDSSYCHLRDDRYPVRKRRRLKLKGKSKPVKVVAVDFADTEALLAHERKR